MTVDGGPAVGGGIRRRVALRRRVVPAHRRTDRRAAPRGTRPALGGGRHHDRRNGPRCPMEHPSHRPNRRHRPGGAQRARSSPLRTAGPAHHRAHRHQLMGRARLSCGAGSERLSGEHVDRLHRVSAGVRPGPRELIGRSANSRWDHVPIERQIHQSAARPERGAWPAARPTGRHGPTAHRGTTPKMIYRCSKRHVIREVHPAITADLTPAQPVERTPARAA